MSATANIARRRERITLMAEEKSQGAGGRLITTTPIIADVWAAAEEAGGTYVERGNHETLPARVQFTTCYRSSYQRTRRIEWRGAHYRVNGLKANRFASLPSLLFEASLMEGHTP